MYSKAINKMNLLIHIFALPTPSELPLLKTPPYSKEFQKGVKGSIGMKNI
jgi:hypothetical protein